MELHIFSNYEHFQSVAQRPGVSHRVTGSTCHCGWVLMYCDAPLLCVYGVRGRTGVSFWPLRWRLSCVSRDSLWDKPAFLSAQWTPGGITVSLAEKNIEGWRSIRDPCAEEGDVEELLHAPTKPQPHCHQASVRGVHHHPELSPLNAASPPLFKKDQTKQKLHQSKIPQNYLPLSINTFL